MDLDIVDYETAGADVILTKPMRMEALDRLIAFCRCKGIVSHFKDAALPPVSESLPFSAVCAVTVVPVPLRPTGSRPGCTAARESAWGENREL